MTDCRLCPHNCSLQEGEAGRCKVRRNLAGKIKSDTYGKVSVMGLDPIEKKPLKMYESGKNILSIGSFGCNLHCPFCQNHEISLVCQRLNGQDYSVDELVGLAIQMQERNNIGIAYTYNEPLVGYEFVLDCAKKIKAVGLKNVLVSNGYINPEPLADMLPYIDAMNIDLKAYRESFYEKLGGSLAPVKQTIEHAHKQCHVEITTLIIPGENDAAEEMEQMVKWIGRVSSEIPLHLSRFFPQYHYYGNYEPTPRETMFRLQEIAKQYLHYVFLGNMG
ncbi:MAG: AmmeMemoRadiSam system radical SAM enzyme [Lachnospiraceae bacterium]|nr:AmmeMemoRadiSam system radical SAM enzyme [Lachnospiraceae bacterium]